MIIAVREPAFRAETGNQNSLILRLKMRDLTTLPLGYSLWEPKPSKRFKTKRIQITFIKTT